MKDFLIYYAITMFSMFIIEISKGIVVKKRHKQQLKDIDAVFAKRRSELKKQCICPDCIKETNKATEMPTTLKHNIKAEEDRSSIAEQQVINDAALFQMLAAQNCGFEDWEEALTYNKLTKEQINSITNMCSFAIKLAIKKYKHDTTEKDTNQSLKENENTINELVQHEFDMLLNFMQYTFDIYNEQHRMYVYDVIMNDEERSKFRQIASGDISGVTAFMPPYSLQIKIINRLQSEQHLNSLYSHGCQHTFKVLNGRCEKCNVTYYDALQSIKGIKDYKNNKL